MAEFKAIQEFCKKHSAKPVKTLSADAVLYATDQGFGFIIYTFPDGTGFEIFAAPPTNGVQNSFVLIEAMWEVAND